MPFCYSDLLVEDQTPTIRDIPGYKVISFHRTGRPIVSAGVMVLGGLRAALPLAAARDGVCASARAAATRSRSAAPSTAMGRHKPRALEDGAGQRANVVSPRLRASHAKGGISAREIQLLRCRRVTPSITNGEAEAGG
jgi:hypothetical protein